MNCTCPRSFVRGLFATALLALVYGSAQAGTLYLARMSGAGENPPNNVTFTGTGVLILNDAENSATITATHNITDPLVGGHIHRGPVGVNGPVIFPFPAPQSPVGPLIWAIPAADVENLKNLGLYMNFHTPLFPAGAIRSPLVRALLAPAAMSPAQMRLANALDISAGYNSDLDSILVQTNLASTAIQTATLSDLSGGTLYVQTRQQLETMENFQGSLFSYFDDTRSTNSAGDHFTTFLRLGEEFGSRDASENQLGSSASHPFVLVGLQYQVGPNTRIGGSIGYDDGKDDFDGGAGQTKVKTTGFNGFVGFTLGDTGITLDAIGGYGTASIDTTRNLTTLARTATGSTNGNVWSGALRASMTMAAGTNGKFVPYAYIDVQKAKADAYTESGAGAADLVTKDREMWSNAFEIGTSYVMAPQSGSTGLFFRFLIGWHYLIDNGESSSGNWLAGSPIGFTTHYDGLEVNSARIEASLAYVLTGGTELSFGYRGLLASGGQQLHTLEAGVSLKF